MLSAMKTSWSNGNILIAGGGLCVSVSGYLLWKMEEAPMDTKTLKTEMSTDRNKMLTSNEVSSDPVLYHAIVTRALSASFDGPSALKGLSSNELVGIVKESVGPNKDYHLARSFTKSGKTPKSEGWYPKRFLKITTPSS